MEHADIFNAILALFSLAVCMGVVFFCIVNSPQSKELDLLLEARLQHAQQHCDVADEPTYDDLLSENAELRAELAEARKWVPYQQGSLMRWGQN